MDDQGEPRGPRKGLKRMAWGTVVALGVGLLVSIGLPLSSALFPTETQTSCTVTEQPFEARGRRGGSVFPRIYTDCGTFRSTNQATCTADPSLQTHLIPGYTYDLTVRGADLPLTTSREIVSAAVSPGHKPKSREIIKKLEPTTDNDLLNETIEEIQSRPESRAIRDKIARLEAEFSPETLRAFDYVQPPFSPECEVSRRVMTTKGMQLMDSTRAAEVLTPPAGTTPRSPLLPCEDYFCDPPIVP